MTLGEGRNTVQPVNIELRLTAYSFNSLYQDALDMLSIFEYGLLLTQKCILYLLCFVSTILLLERLKSDLLKKLAEGRIGTTDYRHCGNYATSS